MANVSVQKVKEVESSTAPIVEEMRRLRGDIEQRAFELFQLRGGELGNSIDDWLQAERETLAAPPAELVETAGGFVLRMAIPGFSAKQIQVAATPQELIVKAEHASGGMRNGEQVCWSELGNHGRVCRRVRLPTVIDVAKVTATLEDGMLVIKAGKPEAVKLRRAAAGGNA